MKRIDLWATRDRYTGELFLDEPKYQNKQEFWPRGNFVLIVDALTADLPPGPEGIRKLAVVDAEALDSLLGKHCDDCTDYHCHGVQLEVEP